MMHLLSEQSELPIVELLGQVLFRYRRAEPLQSTRHRATVESAAWVDGIADVSLAEEVYRACTQKCNGRMTRSQWLKIVQLVQRNPVIRQRVRHSDADRV